MLSILLKKAGETELSRLEKPVTGSWINVVNPTNKEIETLLKIGIPKEFISSSLDPDERPRIDEEEDVKLTIMQIPNIVEGDLETIPLGVISTEKYVVTISKNETKIIEALVNNPKGFFTTKRTRFLFQVFWMTVRSFLGYLSHIEKKIDEMEDEVHKYLGNKKILNLLNIQKTLTYFKSAAYGNQTVLDKIMTGKFLRLYSQDADILDDIGIDNNQAIEMINMYLAITANTMSAYSSIAGNNLNEIMKVLTVLSLTLAIPTIMTGLYGMNVILPFQTEVNAFWIVIAISTLLGTLGFFTFSKLRKL